MTPMEPGNSQDPIHDEDRVRAAQALQDAQSNPVLSGEQSCAVAQVHALTCVDSAR
jgi:hypothetical protein